MRESERVSGRSTGETAKCPLVSCVSDLGHTANTGAHGKHFLFSILNQSMEKNTAKHHFAVCQGYGTRQRSSLPCDRVMAHGKEVLCRVSYPWHTANLLSFHSNLETCFTKFNEMYVAKDYQIN